MTNLAYTVADAEFDDGQLAQGTEVRTRFTDILTFLNGNNLDPTNNIKTSVAYAWTNRHGWTVSDANNDNLALVVSAVMAASKYGFHISSSAAQINSAMQMVELTNASSTVSCYQAANAGSGSTYKAVSSGLGISFDGNNSSASNTNEVFKATQAGSGPLYSGSLRSLGSLNAPMVSKVISTLTTVDNTAVNTAISDLVVTLPANFLQVGTTIQGIIFGQMDTPGAGPATARLRLYYGGTAGTALLDSGAVSPTVSLVDSLIRIEFLVTCISVGVSGTAEAQGMLSWNSNTAPANRGLGTAGTGATNDAVITIDTTQSKDLTLAFAWGSAVSGCTFKARSGFIKVLK